MSSNISLSYRWKMSIINDPIEINQSATTSLSALSIGADFLSINNDLVFSIIWLNWCHLCMEPTWLLRNKKCSNFCRSKWDRRHMKLAYEQWASVEFSRTYFWIDNNHKRQIHQKGQTRSMQYGIWNWRLQFIFHSQI